MNKPARAQKSEKVVLRKLYVDQSKSIRAIAASLGCKKDMVFRALKEYGIEIIYLT